jgi:hypothetical protein
VTLNPVITPLGVIRPTTSTGDGHPGEQIVAAQDRYPSEISVPIPR